jgi:hypothetical protein
MDHKQSKAEKIHGAAFSVDGWIFLPDPPGKKVDDERMVKANKHPTIEISPAEKLIASDLFVKRRLTGKDFQLILDLCRLKRAWGLWLTAATHLISFFSS